jgi:predicted GNAT family N-acyltransferase
MIDTSPKHTLEIEIETAGGTASGVLFFETDSFTNWAENRVSDEELLEYLSKLPLPIAVLNNINVDAECRGRGLGNTLMEEFLDAVYEASSFVLESDSGEAQRPGFNLEEWYEGFGFYTEGRDSSGTNPIMVKLD